MTVRRYDGSTVLITGASRGIGEALARSFASRGASLVLIARDDRALQELAKELRSGGTRVVMHAADLTVAGAAQHLASILLARGVEVDHLVNNAGMARHGEFVELPLDGALATVDLNIRVVIELSRLLLPGMVSRGRGGILSVASTAAFYPIPSLAVYAASKAFILSWSQALARELETTGVQALAVCPGPTDTGLFGSQVRRHQLGVRTMTSAEVAEFAVAAYSDEEDLAIPGLRNRAAAALGRLMPRGLAVRLAERFADRLPAEDQRVHQE